MKGYKMTATMFAIACAAVNITPEIALENGQIVKALQDKNDSLVICLLETQF
jgi:hypothetical protein